MGLGETKAEKPLEIQKSELLQDKECPTPQSEVTGAAGRDTGTASYQGEGNAVGNLSDHELKEKIDRLRSSTALLTRLPDKGAKFRLHLSQLEEEAERRRKFARVQDKDAKECKKPSNSSNVGSSESTKNVRSNSSSQPGLQSPLNQRSETEADNSTCTTFTAKLTSTNQTEPQINMGGQNSKSSQGSSPVRLPISTDNDKQSAPDGEGKDIASSSYPTPCSERRLSSRIAKRRRPCENHEPQQLDWVKVQDVVLLDEEDVQPLQSLEEEDEHDEWKKSKIYHPSREHPECVEICYSDIKCLNPESYLSSTIMNFYIQYLQNPVSQISRPGSEYHFFNTYFYKKLEKAVSCKVDRNANFSKLRRWLKGVNIFQKAYIFLPIHGDLHWSLVIICIPAREDETGPIILHLDSLGFHDSNIIFENIKSYLEEEWRYIYQNASPTEIPISEKIWGHLPRWIKRRKIMVPQQKNEYDCGLFVLYFMERFIEEAPERVRSKDLAKFGSRWFQPEEASGLRKRLRKLLLDEFKREKSENILENHHHLL